MAKLLSLACFRNEGWHNLSPRSHYPSMPSYPKDEAGTSTGPASPMKASKVTGLFSVHGMTCSACAGSVEKSIKRLHGIHEAVVDVLNNRARVIFHPSFVNVTNFLYPLLFILCGLLRFSFLTFILETILIFSSILMLLDINFSYTI